VARDALQRGLTHPEWKATTRVAFRFFVAYLALYAAATQILGGLLVFPGVSLPALGTRWPMREITAWWSRVLRVDAPLVLTGSSGDTAFHWVQTFWLVLVALLVAVVWSELDRRKQYRSAYGWFRLFVRFALAAQMFYYGMAKVIPTQFPAPSLVTLVEQVGNLSLSDLLWTFVGASTPYQIFTGVAEVVAGVLLVVPATATLGALVAMIDMTQVLALNLSYDFGLKQMAAHLILMSAFVAAQDAGVLWRALVLNAHTGVRPQPGPPRILGRSAVAAQLAFGAYLLAIFTVLSWNNWFAISGGRERSALYGIWDVESLSIDGTAADADSAAYDYRWRRVIFDTPDVVVIQRTDNSFLHYVSTQSGDGSRVTLQKGRSALFDGRWEVERSEDDRLLVRGRMEGHALEAQLQRVGFDTFKLLNSTFRWIRPNDPNVSSVSEP
jgi:hypothetical protein